MANNRNCDITGAPIKSDEQNFGRGSHLLPVNSELHLTVTPGRADKSNEGVDLTHEGFAQALEQAAAILREKLLKLKDARAKAAEAAPVSETSVEEVK